jgi:hypothetical protein
MHNDADIEFFIRTNLSYIIAYYMPIYKQSPQTKEKFHIIFRDA